MIDGVPKIQDVAHIRPFERMKKKIYQITETKEWYEGLKQIYGNFVKDAESDIFNYSAENLFKSILQKSGSNLDEVFLDGPPQPCVAYWFLLTESEAPTIELIIQ